MTTSAFEALSSYIESINPGSSSTDNGPGSFGQALDLALAHAEEYALPAPDAATGQLLTTIAAVAAGSGSEKAQAIAISPAASVAGLYLLKGLPKSGILSCIDPEAEHQASAKAAFRTAGYKPAHVRFLPARPLEVIDRLAPESYQVIFADVPVLDALAVAKACWPLLRPGGTVVLAGVLLDGTLSDPTRTDRATQAARALEKYAMELEGATVAHLPLGSGLLLLTKR